MHIKKILFFSLLIFLVSDCSKGSSSNNNNGGNIPPPVITSSDTIHTWLTTANGNTLLQQQGDAGFNGTSNSYATITVDSATSFQTVDGFGYTLTGGSASVINTLDANTKNNLLQELFGNTPNSIGINYLRISIGASDLNAEVFSYDDVAGDTGLVHFTLDKDKTDLIPLLKEIIRINP